MDNIRLQLLNSKIQDGTATPEEKNEYMKILFQNGSISQKQYNDFINGKRTEDLLKVGLAVGAALLLAWLLKKLLDD